MAAVVATMHKFLVADWPAGAALAMEIAVGGVSYSLYVLAIHGARLRAFHGLWKGLRAEAA